MFALPEVGSVVADKYRIEALLGQGGMGAVFRARHDMMGRAYALKCLHPNLAGREEARERFVREARASASIKHPNVVEVYDVGVHNGALFMVMELLEGESFEQLLARGEDLSIPQALRILFGAMNGVQAAHRQGIVHRDIKPDNLFVIEDPQTGQLVAKVLDFGISKLTAEHHAGVAVTRTGSIVGTPSYMSLEQINAQKDVDERTDIYAFGVLLYRALTGRLPYEAESVGALAVQLLTHTPPRPKSLRPELPTALDSLVMKAMARDREQRFGNMGELINALTLLGSTEGFLGLMTHPSTSPPRLTPRQPETRPQTGTEAPHSQTGGGPPAQELQAGETPFGISTTGDTRLRLGHHRRWLGASAMLLLVIGSGWWFFGRFWPDGEDAQAPTAAKPMSASDSHESQPARLDLPSGISAPAPPASDAPLPPGRAAEFEAVGRAANPEQPRVQANRKPNTSRAPVARQSGMRTSTSPAAKHPPPGASSSTPPRAPVTPGSGPKPRADAPAPPVAPALPKRQLGVDNLRSGSLRHDEF